MSESTAALPDQEDLRLCSQWAKGQCPVSLIRELWQAKNVGGQRGRSASKELTQFCFYLPREKGINQNTVRAAPSTQ